MRRWNINTDINCPCGSNKKYKVCCLPFHEGKKADEAVEVMRARYSAFALGNVDFILRTTHPKHIDAQKSEQVRRREIIEFSKKTTFKKLEVLKVERGEPLSYVTFRVFLEQNEEPFSFTEKSTFERVNQEWLYLFCDFQGEFQQT